jgi:hypothetical protein
MTYVRPRAGFVPVPNAAEVSFGFIAGDEVARCVLGMSYTGGPLSAADCTALASGYGTAWVANFIPVMVSGVTLTDCQVRDLSSEFANSQFVTFGVAGSDGSPELPLFIGPVIRWATGIRGRPFRGRTFLPGAPTSAMASGDVDELDTTYQTSIEVAATGYLSAVAGFSSGGHVTSAGVLTRESVTVTPRCTAIVSASVAPAFGIQRRRRSGVA